MVFCGTLRFRGTVFEKHCSRGSNPDSLVEEHIVSTLPVLMTLFQVPTQVPSEGGGAIHSTDPRHRRHGHTGGVGHALPPQSKDLSQGPGHTQLCVSIDASLSISVQTPKKASGYAVHLRARKAFGISPHIILFCHGVATTAVKLKDILLSRNISIFSHRTQQYLYHV